MESFILSLLALSAGTALLIQIRRDYLGAGYAAIAWLIISLSLVSMGYSATQVVVKEINGGRMKKERCCRKQIDCYKEQTNNTCSVNSGCKMENGMCVVDREMCSAKMGKEACDSLVAARGGCYMKPEECKALGLDAPSGSSCCKKP